MQKLRNAIERISDTLRTYALARPLAAILAIAGAPSANAHPHVFVDVVMQVDIDASGVVSGLRYDWTFDDFYSAFMAQGLERLNGAPTSAALAKLAETFVEKLDEVGYFTQVNAQDHQLQITGAKDVKMLFNAGRLRLKFALPLRSPTTPPRKISVKIFDPQYLVALDVKEGVDLIDGPTPCRTSIARPSALSQSDSVLLDDSKRTQTLAPDFGAKLAITIMIDCAAAQD